MLGSDESPVHLPLSLRQTVAGAAAQVYVQSSERSRLAFLPRPLLRQGLGTVQASAESSLAGVRSGFPAQKAGTPIHTGTIVGIVLAVLLIAAIILAGIYINSHPTSTAALFFIEVSGGPSPQPVHSSPAIETNPDLLEGSRGKRRDSGVQVRGSFRGPAGAAAPPASTR